jgi:hypothetical protein
MELALSPSFYSVRDDGRRNKLALQHSGNLFENAGATGSGNPMDGYDKKLTSVRAVAAQTE